MIRPLRGQLASLRVEVLALLGRWDLVERQLPGVVELQAALRRTTVEQGLRARAVVALAASRARQRAGAGRVAPEMGAQALAEQPAAAEATVVAQVVAAAARPERAVAVRARVGAVLAALLLVVAEPVGTVAEVAA